MGLLEGKEEEESYSFSQQPRCQVLGSAQSDSCARSSVKGECGRSRVLYMGYSVRSSAGWRYTEWQPFREEGETCGRVSWGNMSPYFFRANSGAYRQVEMWGVEWGGLPLEQELFRYVIGLCLVVGYSLVYL